MSQIIAVSTLRERIRVLCGLPAFSSSTPITTAAILDLIQTAVSQLGAITKEYVSEGYSEEFQQLTTSDGVSILSMPENCSDVLRLSWLKSSSEDIDLIRATREDQRADVNQGWSNGPVFYRVVGNAFELYPTPDGEYTINCYFNTGLYVSSTSDLITCRDGWDEWIVMKVCGLVRAAQQKPSPEFDSRLERAESMVRRQLRRDRAYPAQARDLRSAEDRQLARRQRPWP